MSDIAEFERRIGFALERIERGFATVKARAEQSAETPAAAAAPAAQDSGEMSDLREALDAERTANAQLSERVRAIREKQETTLSAMEKKLGAMTRAHEAAQTEITRLKRANADLVAANAALVEAGAEPAPHLINRAMQAELESLRAARAAEAAELDDILSGIAPLLEQAEAAATEANDHA
ncbi:hypothetical protein [Pseudothioclava nitratireducens]|jgi:predicted ribosome quality control (RQC) complex YloA/Tae2 family protein|uniref:hypothetical protein n=1 Tax=Pseudothioclava nitratireducens TaxID=1928646 RepID=UPI0023D9AF9F|nr:hypothetical protein [Defluviimonas nitratireducens]MDF1620008.1 hypothetical protein [Defluviimonas nitratireducens]